MANSSAATKDQPILDSIELIGESLIAINRKLADLDPRTLGYFDLERERDHIESQLKVLTRSFLEDTTSRFIIAESALAKSNEQIKKTLKGLKKLDETLNTVRELIQAIDGFVSAVVPIA